MICQYFLPLHRLPFHFVDFPFQKLFSLRNLTCLFLLLLPVLLVSYPNNYCQDQCKGGFSLFPFPIGVLRFRSYVSVFDPF